MASAEELAELQKLSSEYNPEVVVLKPSHMHHTPIDRLISTLGRFRWPSKVVRRHNGGVCPSRSHLRPEDPGTKKKYGSLHARVNSH